MIIQYKVYYLKISCQNLTQRINFIPIRNVLVIFQLPHRGAPQAQILSCTQEAQAY